MGSAARVADPQRDYTHATEIYQDASLNSTSNSIYRITNGLSVFFSELIEGEACICTGSDVDLCP